MRNQLNLRRGDVFLVRFEGELEVTGNRRTLPAVCVRSPFPACDLVTVVPLFPVEEKIAGADTERVIIRSEHAEWLDTDRKASGLVIASVPKNRLEKHLGRIGDVVMADITRLLLTGLGLSGRTQEPAEAVTRH
ncbi:type II toxin-antitoxin system PemK/MazF family toxin [Staphylospora marina]|uniref:type II toxin-antitoxin system PemK/MazF family toxin n=1 Tax=Staphylospora marina TaxID=2490858 RepID=UPI000F5C1481|nr:type II toxin-antitoxin system PemK/MazF family toxin [Staphylospora marina]